jgi:hypothetical protein
MKKIIFILFVLASILNYSQTFEIKQITSGDFDAMNPFISYYSFTNGWVYFEKHFSGSSNIILITYDQYSNSFQDTVELTSGSGMKINPYEDFNRGIVFQTNENGNWDIAYRRFDYGWDAVVFLTNSVEDEFNLSRFYLNEPGFPGNSFVLYERADTIIVLEYNITTKTEYPVLNNTTQYQYSDYIGVRYSGFSGNYPRPGIHVIAVETDSTGNKNLISKYKPENGEWESKNIIIENCECSNPTLQNYDFIPYLIFDDSTSSGIRQFKVYDWEMEKNIEEIQIQATGDVRNFRIDRPHIITELPNGTSELGPFPYSYFVVDSLGLKIRLNKEQTGTNTTDTLINVKYNYSKVELGSLGIYWGESFYTIWEDSADGHIHLFGRWHDYPISDVTDELGLSGFKLSQNFPNPFNPKTKIQYVISSRQFVTLKVYDILGREIATLVDEEKSAGEYEITFDASELPSGIYFYKLSAGEYNQTRKMILLK